MNRPHSAPDSRDEVERFFPLSGECLDGRFVLRRELGSGAAGTVFSAFDTDLGEKVAIKVLHPDLRDLRTRERLRREVRASRPGHPNAVTVYDLHEGADHTYLSLELVDGECLRDCLKRTAALNVDEVISIGAQVAAALTHLHANGIIHRDVKPGNILLTADGTCKLCDMGLARPLAEGVTVTETEMVVGTPLYMAPEQAIGDLAAESDIYALGLTLYSCLTGEIPLTESTALATLHSRQARRPVSIRRHRKDCPRWLDRLILRMLEPRKVDRPSAHDVQTALKRRRLWPKPRRQTMIFTALFLSFAGLVAILVHLNSLRMTATVEIGRTSIIGRDYDGAITWKRDLAIPVNFHIEADLDGDGQPEYIVGLQDDSPKNTGPVDTAGPEILVLDRDGVERTHFIPEDEADWPFPYPRNLGASAKIIDIDHDQDPELVVVCNHATFYPSVVFVYHPLESRWDQILAHTGYIYDITARPPHEGAGLRFLAVNNRLGLLGFAGEIEYRPAQPRGIDEEHPLLAPPLNNTVQALRYSWVAYVPLWQPTRSVTIDEIFTEEDEPAPIQLPLASPRLDRYFNSLDSPNHGQDLRQLRLKFMEDLFLFTPLNQPIEARSVEQMRDSFESKYDALLAEPAYRVVFDVVTAQALARVGANSGARGILRATLEQARSADCTYQLARLSAIAGDFAEAYRLLSTLDEIDWQRSRVRFDGPHLRLRIAIHDRNQSQFDKAVNRLGTLNSVEERWPRTRATMKARARLWWDEIQPQDRNAATVPYAPSGDAIACLVRWRLGESRPQDVDEMRRFVDASPDARSDGQLALSAALIANGNPDEAINILSQLIEELQIPARLEFSAWQQRQLAGALRAVAIEAIGNQALARSTAVQLKPQLTPGLLPAILVDEVISRTE